jgi:lipopolysaccharide export system protein LptC
MQGPNPRTIGKFVFLIVAVLISSVLFNRSQQPANETLSDQLSLAYYLDSAELSGTDSNGEMLYQVWADHASQVTDDDSITMRKVRMVYTPNGPQAWNLVANTGRIPADSSVIELNGIVVVKSGQTNIAATTILSQHLVLDPATRKAQTQESVVVNYNGQKVNATGLKADLKNNRLQLLADINGSFAPRPAALID